SVGDGAADDALGPDATINPRGDAALVRGETGLEGRVVLVLVLIIARDEDAQPLVGGAVGAGAALAAFRPGAGVAFRRTLQLPQSLLDDALRQAFVLYLDLSGSGGPGAGAVGTSRADGVAGLAERALHLIDEGVRLRLSLGREAEREAGHQP